MSWSVGYDARWKRDIGYGVPSICDHPKCDAAIDRGLSYVCGAAPHGGEKGCGLFFCSKHQVSTHQRCPRCAAWQHPYKRPKPDSLAWIQHKLTHESWRQWRNENPLTVTRLTNIANADTRQVSARPMKMGKQTT
jgi:hypothetical protein